MDFVAWALALVAGMGIGFALAWLRGKQMLAGAVARTHYDALIQEKVALQTKLEGATTDLDQTRSKLTEFHERAVTAEADKKALEQRLKEQQEQLRLEFNNLANKIFENISTKFTVQSEEKIGNLLKPVRERLEAFQKLVGDSFTTQRTEQNSLKDEIGKIVLQADSLTKALRGDVKAQGNWGEVMLERILEESGLRPGIDYIVQATDMDLSGADGNRLRPDIVVKLPDGKHIIVDAKVSLSAYERYCAEPGDVHIRDFLKSVRAHVSGLEQKRYQDIEKLGSPDLVLMFVPTEGAFSFAMQHDQELQMYAWGKKINIVSPSTLFANLRTIASIWRIEQQNRHALQIADEGGKMYDKFASFVQDMLDIGKQMGKAQQVYDQAMNKLQSGTGNLLSRAEKMKQLGVKASKALPASQAGDDTDDVASNAA